MVKLKSSTRTGKGAQLGVVFNPHKIPGEQGDRIGDIGISSLSFWRQTYRGTSTENPLSDISVGMKRVSVGSGHRVYQPSGAYQRVFFGPGNQVRPFIMTEFGIPSSGVFEISVRANVTSSSPVPMRVHLYVNGTMISHTPYQYGGVYTLYKTLRLPQGSVVRLYLEKKSGPPSEARIMGSQTSIVRVQ